MKKFLLGAIVLMLVLYAMAVPYVNYYSTLENMSEVHMEHALVMGLQMTSCFAMVLIILGLLAYLWISECYKPNRQ